MSQQESGLLALKVLVSPRDLNSHGTLFGGQMLSWFDQAGAIIAAEAARNPIMTVGANNINFIAPAYGADEIQIMGEVMKRGRTSVHVRLTALRRSITKPEQQTIATAEFSYAAVDAQKRPTPLDPSATIL